MPNSDMNRYHPTGETFTGGQGAVEVAKDAYLERLVAIKSYPVSEDIYRELSLLKTIRSKHVVNLFDLIQQPDRISLVQEYLTGTDLRGCCITLSDRDALEIIYQVACGIDDIHKAGLIHRDIKPTNMKFDENLIVKIFDFGIASIQDVDTHTMRRAGTPGYKAPEFYATGPVLITPAMDVFAFGVSVWRMLTNGLPPELQEYPPCSSGPAPSILAIRPSFPQRIGDLINKGLATAAVDRPSMEDARFILHAELVKGRHIARLTINSQQYQIDKNTSLAGVKVTANGKALIIAYDGYDFNVLSADTGITANRSNVISGFKLNHCCILDFGSCHFVPFDMSHPDVAL